MTEPEPAPPIAEVIAALDALAAAARRTDRREYLKALADADALDATNEQVLDAYRWGRRGMDATDLFNYRGRPRRHDHADADNGDEAEKTVDERLSEELGVDIAAVEQQLRFRLDHARMQRGQRSQLGYLFIERQHHPDAVVVFDNLEAAEAALVDHPLVDALCEEDYLDAYIGTGVTLPDLAGCEVILP